MRDIELKKRGVYLGKTGETGRYRVWLDVSAWAEEYSGGTGLLLYTDPKGNTAPMRTTVEFDGEKTKIYGLVTEEETKESGTGVIEARWMSAGVVAKSDHYNTVVMESIYTGQNVGDNTPDWVRDLMTELNAVDVLIDEAKQMADQVDDIRATIEGAETAAVEAAGDSEAWAVGKRGGEDVEHGDQTYQHNSLYYAMQAGGMANAARDQAREAEAWAVGQRAGLDVETTDGTYHNNAKYYAQHAREEAEAWAVGKRSGTDVGSEDPAYHNNAKYYSEHAFSTTPEGYEALVDDVDLMMESFEAERSGRVVLVPAGTGTPVKDLKVYIEAAQDLSYGAPSQSNVRPITGHAQVYIYRVGKNLFNKDAAEVSPNNTAAAVGTNRIFTPNSCCRGIGGDNGYSASDVTTFSISGDSVLVKSTNGYGAGFAVPVAGGQGYVLTANTVSNGEARVICYKADGTPVIMGSGDMLGVPFTAPEDAEMAVIILNPPASLNGTRTATFTKVQLEAGPTATAYEAYSVDGAAMSAYGYAGYVYGGYWDVDAKKLYVTHKNIASYAGETLPGRWISSMETYAAGRTPTTGAQVVYELAQPEVYDLTNEVQLNTLTGFCEFWAPTGRVEMSVTMSLKGRVEAVEAEAQEIAEDVGDLKSARVKDVQTDGTSIVNSNKIANIPRASSTAFGVVKTGNSVGTGISTDGKVQIYCAPAATIKEGTNQYQPIVPYNLRHAVFYGLPRAAGDETQAASSNPVGTYTSEAKAAIKEMLGVSDPAVRDVQTNGTTVLSDGVANIPVASSSKFGVVKTGNSVGTGISTDGKVQIYCASAATIKEGTNQYQPIVPYNMRHATFYGLAKAAGDDTQAASSNPVGTYTDEAKAAIKEMLGISETSGAVRDVQTNGTSVLSNGVANIPVANGSRFGVVKTGNSVGTTITTEGKVGVYAAYAAEIKAGTDMYRPIVPAYIKNAAFHGLAKAAGDETQAASSNLVGDYTQSAKTAINKMLGSQEKNELNELINPAVNMSGDATIATAGTAVKCMKGLYLKANKVYRFTFTTASGLANDGAIAICGSSGTAVANVTLAQGETAVGVDVNVTSDVTDGYVTLTFGDAGAVIHCEYRAKEYDTIHDFVHKGVGLDLGRRFKFMYHFGVDTLGQNEIPPNSLMDIDVAHRLGFTAYRLMPHATATPGKYICLHGNNGKFGVEVVARNGNDISNVAISSVPYSTILSDYVYNTTNELYRTPPTLLDDALMRLKRYNMLPVISFSDYDGVDYITNLIGDKYVLLVYSKWYLGGKSRFLGVHSLYQSLTDAEFREVITQQAKPFNIALTSADLQSLTDEQIKARIDFAHANNCTISSAAVYDTTAITQKLLDMGLDYTASGWEVEDFMDGNLASLHANGVFSEFTHEGTVSGGVLTLGNGKKIGTNITMTGTPTVAKGALRIRFVGTLNIKYRSDANAVTFTSDGTKEVVLTSAFLRAVPGFEATASGTVKVYDCCYDATVC